MRLGPILKLSWFVVKFVVKEVAYEIAFKTIADGPRAHPLGYFGAMVAVAGAVVAGVFVSLVFSLGYIWILIDQHRQGWHDKLAGTVVIEGR